MIDFDANNSIKQAPYIIDDHEESEEFKVINNGDDVEKLRSIFAIIWLFIVFFGLFGTLIFFPFIYLKFLFSLNLSKLI